MYYRNDVTKEIYNLLDVNGEYDIFVAKNLNNELKEIIIRQHKNK